MDLSGPSSNAWCLYKKRKQTHRNIGKATCDDTGRDWSDAATSRGTPRLMAVHRSPERGLEETLLLSPEEGIDPADALILYF